MILYLFSVWGATHILVSGKILNNFRNWLLIKIPFLGEMLECYQCTSFWVSILFYFMFDNLELGTKFLTLKGFTMSPDFILWGFIGSGLVSFMSAVMAFLIKSGSKN